MHGFHQFDVNYAQKKKKNDFKKTINSFYYNI